MANEVIYGLIGEKLSHSMSRTIHKMLGGYDYQIMPIERDMLADFFTRHEIGGINVTIPYKQEVIAFCDRLDISAQEIGAVNTIITQNGQKIGYNTDFFGLKSLILDAKIDVFGAKILILGAGGTAKTAQAVCKSLGASEVFFASRSAANSASDSGSGAAKNASDSGSDAAKNGENTYAGASHSTVSYQAAKLISPDVIINTTPCGMFPSLSEQPIDLTDFPSVRGVVDVIYNPLKTKLVMQAESLGIRATGGLKMLVNQAARAYELFTSDSVSTQRADEIYKMLKGTMENIVLIGMPGSGKSVIGKALARSLCRSFYDVDEEIERAESNKCANIINERGESYFRALEYEACVRLSSKTGAVIATGGGCVKNKDNICALMQNGVIVYVDRPLASLATDGRPLSSGGRLEQLYSERSPLYQKYAHITVTNDGDLQQAAAEISARFI